MPIEPRLLVNFAAFQAGWFACVLGAANGWPLSGALAAAAAVALHLFLSRRPRRELVLIAAAMAIGAAWDSAVIATGLLAYPAGQAAPELAPWWIVAMWALFGTTLNGSLAWLRRRPLLAALAGAIGAPLAFLAGARLGAVQLVEPLAALALQAAGWALLLPLLGSLAAQLDGYRLATVPERARV